MPRCDFGGPPAPPQLLEPPLLPMPPFSGASAPSSNLPAMRASTLDEACLHDYYIKALRVCPRSSTRSVGGERDGHCFQARTYPTPAPLNPQPHGAFATALPPWFKGRNGPEGKREDKGTGIDL